MAILIVGGGAFAAWKVRSQQAALGGATTKAGTVTTTALSKEAGIEVLSEPAGALVWLDGAPARGPMGETRTNLIISPVTVGKHVIELKGDAKFKPWREEITLEDGDLAKLTAVLLPIDSQQPESLAVKARRATIIHAGYHRDDTRIAPAISAATPVAVPVAPSTPIAAGPEPIAAAIPEGDKSLEKVPARLEGTHPRGPMRASLTTGMGELSTEAPKSLSTQAARQQLLIDPNDEQYKVRLTPALEQAGMNFWAVLKICVSPQGNVTDVKIVRPADPAIDSQFPSLIGRWRYRPYMVDGRPTAFCYLLRYEIDTR
jgi:hypothetical protein